MQVPFKPLSRLLSLFASLGLLLAGGGLGRAQGVSAPLVPAGGLPGEGNVNDPVSGPPITTVAGNQRLGGTYSGDGGPATNAGLNYPGFMAVDGAGNLYIMDGFNHVVRKVDAGGTITTVAGNASLGGGWSGDGGPATNARLSISCGITFDDAGNLYIADSNNHVVRKVDTGGTITTVAGNHRLGGGYSGDGGPATNAALNFPDGVALDRAGNLFISEYYNHVVRKVDAGGIITTVAGNRRLGGSYSGDGGPATEAGLNGPTGLAVDGSGNLYFSEGGNHVIRKVDAGGTITTVAGNRRLGGGYSGDGGPATNAALSHPNYIAVDGAGNLYFPEYYNNVVRMVNAAGTISTLAGSRGWGRRYPGSGGAVAPVTLNNPTGVALDGRGSLYIGDAHNNVVRKIGVAVPAGKITPVAAVLPVKTAVTVSPTPTLQMVKQNGSFLLSWPIGARGYQLLTAYSLTGPWEPLEAEFTTNGNEVNVSILATNQEQYFRFQ